MNVPGLRYDLDALFPKEADCMEEEICLKDYEYLKRLYPKQERWISSIVEDYMDRLEYEGSPMYAQYPDAVTVYRIAAEICRRLTCGEEEKESGNKIELIQIMVCHEMYVRRRRHDRFCRKFAGYDYR